MSSSKNTGKQSASAASGHRKPRSWKDIDFPPTEEEYFSQIEEQFPRQMILSFKSIKAAARKHYHPPAPKNEENKPAKANYRSPSINEESKSPLITCHCNETQNQQLTAWVQNELRSTRLDRKKSLVLYGPAGLGKSLWARSLGRHAYFTSPFRVGEFDESVQYAVFENLKLNYKSIPTWKFWLGCKEEFTVSDPRRRKKNIKWGKVSILVCEEDPRVGMDQADVDYLEVNCVFVQVEDYVGHLVDGDGRPVIDEGMPKCRYCSESRDLLGGDVTRKRKIGNLDSDSLEDEGAHRQKM